MLSLTHTKLTGQDLKTNVPLIYNIIEADGVVKGCLIERWAKLLAQ